MFYRMCVLLLSNEVIFKYELHPLADDFEFSYVLTDSLLLDLPGGAGISSSTADSSIYLCGSFYLTSSDALSLGTCMFKTVVSAWRAALCRPGMPSSVM